MPAALPATTVATRAARSRFLIRTAETETKPPLLTESSTKKISVCTPRNGSPDESVFLGSTEFW